jgi:hypothetical protein
MLNNLFHRGWSESTNVGVGSPWPLPSRVVHGGLVYKVLTKELYANNIGSRVFLFPIFFSILLMHLLKEYLGNS